MAAQESRFGILIEAHNRARAALAEAERQVKTLQTTTDGAASSTTRMNRASEAMGRALGAVKRAVEGAAAGMTRFSGVLTAIGGVAGATALGLTALAAGFVLLARSAGNAQEEMDQITERTGLTSRAVGALKIAASEAGMSFQQLSPGLDLFNRKIAEAVQGDEKAIQVFKDLGVTLRDEVTGALKSTDELLGETAAALKGIAEPTERTRLAMETFGRSGSRFIAVLNADLEENKRRAEELGLVYSEDIAEAARSVDSSFDRMGTAMEGLMKSLGGLAAVSLDGIIAQVADLAEWLAKAAKDASDLLMRLPKTQQENANLSRAGLVMTPTGPMPRHQAEAFARGDTSIAGSSWQSLVGYATPGTSWPPPGPPMPTLEQMQEIERATATARGGSGATSTFLAGMNSSYGSSIPGFGAIRSLGVPETGPAVIDATMQNVPDFQGISNGFMEWITQFEDYSSILAETTDEQGRVNESAAATIAVLQDSEPAWQKAAQDAKFFKDTVTDAVGAFVSTVFRGTEDIGAAFKRMIEDIVTTIATQQVTSFISGILFPKPMAYGGVIGAAGGMSVVSGGVRGFDSVLTAMQPGERVLNVQRNDQFERMVDRIDQMLSRGGQGLGSTARTMIANFYFQVTPENDRASTRRYVREMIAPELIDYLTNGLR